MTVRLLRDRSRWTIEVSGPDGKFIDVELWRDLLDGTGPSIGVIPRQDLLKLLEARLDEIEHLASAPDFAVTAAAFVELGRGRAKLLFLEAFPD